MKSISVIMEENNQKGDSGTAFKNAGSFVKIDSISIDLNDGIAKSYVGTKCEQFSMRGYVSDIRRRNWKLCWPFALDDKNTKFENEISSLPPLLAPKFKCWSCQSCLQEISSEGLVKNYDNSCTIGSQFNDTSSLMPSLSSFAAHDRPNFPQDSSWNMGEKTKVDVNTFTEMNRSMNQIPSCNDRKEVIIVDAPISFIEAMKLEWNSPLKICKHSCKIHGFKDVEFAIHTGISKSCTEMLQTEKENSSNEQHMELKKASGTSVLACLHDGAGNDVNRKTNELGFQVLDEYNNASSESVEILAGKNVQDHNSDKLRVLQRKKTQKVRLLTELLYDNVDSKTDHIFWENSSSKAINKASAGVGIVSVPIGQGLGDNKKRKLRQDEGSKLTELSSQSSVNKMFKSFKGGEESVNSISSPVSKKDSSVGLYLQTSTKSSWSDYRNDRNSIAGKKNIKKIQIIDKHPSLFPTGGTVLNQISDEVGILTKVSTVDGIVPLKEVKNASTSRGRNETPMGFSRKEWKLLFKKKGKMTQVDDGQGSQLLWNSSLHINGSNTRNDEVVHNGTVNVSFRQAEDDCREIKSHLSFRSYLATQRGKYNKKHAPQVKDGPSSLLSLKEGTPMDQIMRKKVDTNYISDLSIPSNLRYPFINKQVHSEVSSRLNMYNFPVLNEKQKSNAQIEEGYCSLMKQVDVPGASNISQIIKGKERSAVSRKDADEIICSVSEQGPSVVIPMEIVELMAKNQYERCLDTAESKKCQLETANEGRNNQSIGYDKVYGAKEIRLSEETSESKNCSTRNEIKDTGSVRKNIQPAKQKSVDYFSHINRDQFDIKHLDQKKSSSVQFSSIGYAQNCKWNGDTCQIDSAQKEEATHFWSSKIPHHAPVRHKDPQKAAFQPVNLDVPSNSPGFLHKGNILDMEHELKFLNPNATNFEKHYHSVSSEIFRRRRAEYPLPNKQNGIELQQNLLRYSDLYSNETISAVHLLSLMDAGMQSGAALKTDSNLKLLKRVSPLDRKSKGHSLLDVGVLYKNDDTSKGLLDHFSEKQLSEKSHDLFSANPTIDPSSSSHQSTGFGNINGFVGHVSFSPRRKEKVLSSSSAAQNRGHTVLNSSFASGDFGTNHNISVHSIRKGLLGASGSMVIPLQLHTPENLKEHKFAVYHTIGTFWPLKTTSEPSFCSINKNPADFSILNTGNEYMIRGEDWKFEQRKRHGLISADQCKQQRNAKRITENECPRH